MRLTKIVCLLLLTACGDSTTGPPRVATSIVLSSTSLVGGGFLFFWQDKALSELFTTIQTRMPTDAPNSLPTRTYLNILSYILEANKFPAGESDLLDPAALRRIIITAKP